jgi:hypothetical protein
MLRKISVILVFFTPTMSRYLKLIKFTFIILLILIISLNSCHPFYKRLTRGGWGKDTVFVKFPDLPKPILDTLIKYYESTFTKDTTDDIPDLISFNLNKQFIDVGYYDAYSPKLRLPFGQYFKLGKKKYFIHYSDLSTPLIYYNNYLFFPAGAYYDSTISKLRSQFERWPYDKQFYVKYKLK